ncbi:hypothetical protein R6Q57_025927 [Mikania cordata]
MSLNNKLCSFSGKKVAYCDAGVIPPLLTEDYLSSLRTASETIFSHSTLNYRTKEYYIELNPLFSAFQPKSFALTSLRSFLLFYLPILVPKVEDDDNDFSPDSSDEHHIDLVGLYTMSGSRGSRRSRGSRGRVLLQGDRSGMRQLRDSESPATSDGTNLQVFTSGGRRIYRGGYTGHPPSGAGSTSRGGMGDPMGDMQGVLREHAYHQDMQALVDIEDDDYEPELGDIDGSEDGNDDDIDYHDMHDSISIDDASHASQRPFISRIGEGFASSEIHISIGRVLREHLSGPWTTYRKVPQKVVIAMFKRFKTRWNWEKDNEQYIYDGFVNMLKKRYRDIMLGLRRSSLNYASKAGHDITIDDPEVFNVIRNFPPDLVAQNVWGQMCEIWNTEDWRKKSTSAKDNRSKTDTCGKTSRHTGGSIGYDERRLRLRVKLGKEPTFLELFLDTHLNKKCKKRLWAGELNVKILEGLQFCTERVKEAYADYLQEMTKEYGLNFTQDDARVWERLHGNGGPKRVFGIGSSDLDFVVTGTTSSSYGIGRFGSSIGNRAKSKGRIGRTNEEDE